MTLHAAEEPSQCATTTEACMLQGPRATANEPKCCNYQSPHALEPASHKIMSLHAATTEPHGPTACAPQQEKPSQWEAHPPSLEKTPLSAIRESPRTATKTQHSLKKKKKLIKNLSRSSMQGDLGSSLPRWSLSHFSNTQSHPFCLSLRSADRQPLNPSHRSVLTSSGRLSSPWCLRKVQNLTLNPQALT